MGCLGWDADDWGELLTSIEDGNCILMLGPDVSAEEHDGRFQACTEVLAKQLSVDKEIKDLIAPRKIDDSNLVQISQVYRTKVGKNKLDSKAKEFYNSRNSWTSEIHRDLAAIPFYFTVVTTPDYMFPNALREKPLRLRAKKEVMRDPIVEVYNYRGGAKDIVQMGTKEKPLIFYLYGTIDVPNSLVLAEDDFLDLLVAVVKKDPALPKNVLSELQNKGKILLFLGFGFRRWYLRILLHVLQVRSKESRSFALEQFDPSHLDEVQNTIFFYKESDYKIQICDEKLEMFAKTLRNKYEQCVETDRGFCFQVGLPPRAPTIFICHAGENKSDASHIYEQLTNSGFKPWLDKESLRGGDRWDSQIERTIREEIDYFVVLQSKALLEKNVGYVNKEIGIALERQKEFRPSSDIRFIIPVKIEECPLVPEVKDLQCINLYEGNGIEKLVSIINRDQQVRGR